MGFVKLERQPAMTAGKSPPCPKCGGESAQLKTSRNLYPDYDPKHRSPPTGVVNTFECPCGEVWVVCERYDIQRDESSPP
jgi:hypothetical protein